MLSQSWFLITLIYPNGAPIDAVNRKLAVCANAGVRLNRFKAAHKRRKNGESVMRGLIVDATERFQTLIASLRPLVREFRLLKDFRSEEAHC